ncbi:unnamed protein product [Orchesella dallaii]|uniref:DUF6606 domain-containing protein n=1 Tax=Orchesella dallaii TaxID=48710 RepID=A0ABP1RF89_9HEXA
MGLPDTADAEGVVENGYNFDSSTPRTSNQEERLEKEDLSSLIFHTFLPRKIPDCRPNDLLLTEDLILRYMRDTISGILARGLLPELESTRGMFEKWMQLQPQHVGDRSQFTLKFQESVRNLKVGDTISIYIRKQNGTIMIRKMGDEKMKIMTFRPSLTCDTVMSSVGSLVMDFPETTDVVLNAEILSSKMFASQLHELSTEVFELSMPKSKKGGHDYAEYREVADPFLLSDWIVGLLLPTSSENVSQIKVTKKIRDEANCKTSSSALPFRRSGMWMSVKVALQLQIMSVIGDYQLAKIIYKVVLLWALAKICDGHKNENMDESCQMLAKIGRRVAKLENMKNVEGQKENLKIITTCLEFVASVVNALEERTNSKWTVSSPVRSTINNIHPHVIPPINITKIGINKSLQHHIPSLNNYLSAATQTVGFITNSQGNSVSKLMFQNPTADIAKSLNLQRYTSLNEIMAGSANFSRCTTHQQRIWLYDTENFIKKHLDSCSSESILQLIFTYVKIALPKYKNGGNPMGFSQMLLCILKSIQVLDKIATKAYELLLQYKSGIDCAQFDRLLLPHEEDMRFMEQLLDYFQSRDNQANFPSIVSARKADDDTTFAVCFAKNDEGMQTLREKILEDMEKKIASKYAEVDEVRERCKTLQDEIAAEESCKCEWKTDSNGHRRRKITNCQRCKLESTLASTRHSVPVYERPLPPTEVIQHAVIFELKLPSQLAELRDALAFLNFEILTLSPFDGPSHCVQKWLEYSSVTDYYLKCKQGKVVNLCSTNLPASKTHHTLSNPDVLSNYNSQFIVNNGMNCIYNDQKVICGTGNVEQSCTFQISNTCSPAREMYQRLQYTVAGTSHSQNQVFAESYNCHKDMTIAEFISFGSIRAGHRIQLRNLRRSISNRSIALETEPAVCLIFQTLWQLGPKDQDGNRESHLDFTSNDPFSQEFLECLEQVVDLNETNYSHPLILLNVVAITMRIMELNQSSRELAVKLLRKCRNVVDGWVQRIEESIMKQTDCSSAGVQSLKKCQLEAALCSAFTFNTPSTALLNSLFQTNEDLFQWVSSMSRLHEFTELETLPISSFSRTLVQYAFDVALKVQEQIKLNFSNSLILHSFTVRQWNKANELNLVGENWRCVAHHHSNLFYGEYIEAQSTIQHFVTFDILLGIFLVDGQPQGVLPATIEGHTLYKRFFKNSRLRIQKDYQSYRTVLTFHGKHYEFVPKPGALHHHCIREINEDCTLELLDPSLFQGYVASSFIHNYTHWLNIKDNIIYFRPLPFKNLEYNLPSDFSLTRNVSEGFWKLQDSKSGSHFLSIRSQEYATICEAMKKIEMREHINIVVDSKSGLVTAKLPRYNLKFHLIGEKLQSVEYPDFKISRDQRMGTLVGLRQGILLDNIASSDGMDIFQVQRRMLIVPHGALHVREAQTTHHHGVEVSLDNLRQPPFFSYEFDEELKRLKADKSKTAWLFLAALHAATSSGLSDTFTGITGTEMAVWILQSALVWSNSPYDAESLAILKTIRDLSPVRTFYGAGCGRNSTTQKMEITAWPNGLSSLAAFDGFTFIVDRLIGDSQRLAELFPGSTSRDSSQNSPTRLQIRAYRRSLSFYNQDVAVKPDYLPKSLLSHVGTGNVETPQLRVQLHCDKLLAVSQAIYCFDTMKYPLSDKKYDLISYLCTSQPLSASNPVNWLKLYSHCLIRGKKNGPDNQVKLNEEIQAWKILLANVGYRDPSFVTLQQILNIHFIASHALYFPEPPAPDYSYTNPAANTFVASEIVRLLMNNSYSFMCWEDYRKTKCYLVHSDTLFWKLEPAPRWCFSDHEEELKLYNEEKSQFELELKNDVNSILQAVTDDWPCHSVQTDKKRLFQSHKLKSEAALASVNTQLRFWFKNHELKLFVQDVERILNIILSLSRSFGADERLQPSEEFLNQFGHMKIIKIPINIKTDDPPMIDLEAHLGSFVNADNLVLAKEIFSRGWRWRSDDSQNSIWKLMERRGLLIDRFVYSISTNLQSTISKQVILRTGICPRTTPLALLSYLMNHQQHQGQGLMKQSNLNCVVGAMAVLWSHMKRHNRIITLKSKGDAMSVELKREWENSGHENWSPAEHPEWLLLELDLDIVAEGTIE